MLCVCNRECVGVCSRCSNDFYKVKNVLNDYLGKIMILGKRNGEILRFNAKLVKIFETINLQI